jgi:hypothetical protein
MTWRKWLVRSLVFSVLGGGIAAALLYESWTNPAAVRTQVVSKLGTLFVGATVNLESARLRLLGGIVVRDLRMARRDDLDRGDFLYAPSAIIYHDKEHLLDGRLRIRMVELDRPRLRIVRERDGRLNLENVLAPPDLNEKVPTLIIRQGSILIEDRAASPDGPLLEIKDVNLTIMNDPLPTLVLEGEGQTDVVGAVQLHARFHRATTAASASVELPEVPVGPPLVQRLAGCCPELAAHLRRFQATGKLHATFVHRPGATQPWSYDVHCQLRHGEWCHACLPTPLQQIEASLRCVNGRVPEAHLKARAGAAAVEVKLWDVAWPGYRPECIEDVVQKLDARVTHFTVCEAAFEQLPLKCKNIQRMFSPSGPVSLHYAFERMGGPRWHRRWEIRPEGMSAEFEHFRYAIEGLTGSVDVDLDSENDDRILVDLAGRASGRSLSVKGSLRGEKLSEVDLTITGVAIPIDHKLMSALPERSRELARSFLPVASRELGLPEQPLNLVEPAGQADIKVCLRRERGQHEFKNRYVLAFHNTSLRYDLFPYPLENVSGVLDIQPDHWECQNFHGTHKGGEIAVNGCSFRVNADAAAGVPGEGHPIKRECVQVAIRGQGILLDREFEQALSPPEVPGRAALRNAWSMLALQGRLNFEAVVVDRPDQPQDIDVAVDIRGCTMKPEFFRYSMSDVSAGVRYAHGRVYVKDASARHASCALGLREATIELKPAGGFRAWIKGIRGTHLLPDHEFLQALHPAMRKALEPLQIQKPIDVDTSLVLDAPGGANQGMRIWWDGGAALHDQVFQAGVEINGVEGQIWCHGYHNGQHFEGITGHAVLDRATILGQPFRRLQGRIEVAPDTPDVLRLYDLKADLFGGFVGGEARFQFDSSLRYDVKLDALQVQLDQFGKHNHVGSDVQLQGPVRASIHLTGEGMDLTGLKGNGRIDVANGKLYRLPFLLGLLKAFGLRWPDRTAFEQARMLFAIEGPQMRIHGLDLYGDAISLRGQGTLNLDGSNLNLDFSADWGRMSQMMLPGINDLSQALSDQLFKIKVRGKIASPRFDKELIPAVVDPIKKAFGGS